jgi:biotin carboxyl carrier protein
MIRKLRITVAEKVYDVEVEVLDEAGRQGPVKPAPSAQVASASVSTPAGPSSNAAPTGGAGAVPSPLAGKVVSVSVKAGDSVAQGDTVVVLEAMKMNTLVTAPAAGAVTEILVKPGDAVEEGQTLLTIN